MLARSLLSTAIFFFPALRRHSPPLFVSPAALFIKSLKPFKVSSSRPLLPPLKASSPIAQDCLFPVPLIKTLLALASLSISHALCCIPAICGTFSGFPHFALRRDLAACSVVFWPHLPQHALIYTLHPLDRPLEHLPR
ncbi:hypothetical protein DFH09DRAFT_1315740 [Mycena vulgaris]|nr:hypothetical protein DFH09DRAFT_1315740 [Mycena vulgaris]